MKKRVLASFRAAVWDLSSFDGFPSSFSIFYNKPFDKHSIHTSLFLRVAQLRQPPPPVLLFTNLGTFPSRNRNWLLVLSYVILSYVNLCYVILCYLMLSYLILSILILSLYQPCKISFKKSELFACINYVILSFLYLSYL